MPDIGNMAKTQTHSLIGKTHKHVVIMKCNDIIGKVVDATGTCCGSTSLNEGVRQSPWGK